MAAFGGPERAYPWPRTAASYTPLSARLPSPPEARRLKAAPGSYGRWLRHLPVRPAGSEVRSHDGRRILSGDDRRLAAVVDLDLVQGDLQQCADTVLRLRAEYLLASGLPDEIAFDYTSGFRSRWSDYQSGLRPKLVDGGRRVIPTRRASPDDSRPTFVKYLRDLFSYAGTVSLAREAAPVGADEIAIGDFFILPGGPGHTVLVVDLAEDAGGTRHALLAQSFMPAQDLHVLRASAASPWFSLVADQPIDTPFWKPFPWDSLRRLE